MKTILSIFFLDYKVNKNKNTVDVCWHLSTDFESNFLEKSNKIINKQYFITS